ALGELGHARREVELEAGEPAVELAADRGGEADSDLVRVALVELDEVEVEADRLPLVDAAGPGVLRARGPHADAVTHLPAVRVDQQERRVAGAERREDELGLRHADVDAPGDSLGEALAPDRAERGLLAHFEVELALVLRRGVARGGQ